MGTSILCSESVAVTERGGSSGVWRCLSDQQEQFTISHNDQLVASGDDPFAS